MKAEAGVCVVPAAPLSLNKRVFTLERFDYGGNHEKEVCSTHNIAAGPGNLRPRPGSHLPHLWNYERCCG
jgi:hypothetical protein